MTDHTRIILASNSPRRRELLAQMGVDFSIDVPDIDEHDAATPQDTVRGLALQKARAVAARHAGEQAVILSADTVVFAGEILGKPRDREDARRMLNLLQGRWHEVYTGVCAMRALDGRHEVRVERTRVLFVPMTGEQIDRYIDTGEPMDKAGAYAIQGRAGMFVERIEGSSSNVVGLPMATVRGLLMAFGVSL